MEPVVIVAFIVALVALVLITIPLWYIKSPPDKAFIISGLGRRKVIIGKSGVKIPFLQRLDKLSLEMVSVDVKTDSFVPTNDYINVKIDGAVKIKIGSDQELIELAAQNFLNRAPDYIIAQVKDVLEGNTREIIGSMPFESIVQDRKSFVEKVQENAVPDLRKMGLEIISFNVQSVIDENNIIVDLGIDNVSQIRKKAQIAKAQADRDVAIATSEAKKMANDAEVLAETEIASKQKELAVRVAEFKIEQDTKQAEADAAYKIQMEERRAIIEEKTAAANLVKTEKEVLVRQRILQAEIEKQAEADKFKEMQMADAELYRRQQEAQARLIEKQREAEGILEIGKAEAEAIRAKALAEAEGINAKAEAMKKYGEAAILEMYFDKLPDIAKNVAEPLTNVEKITMYGDAQNAKLVGDIVKATTQISDGLTEGMGIDIKSFIQTLMSKKEAPMDIPPMDIAPTPENPQ
ncbi:MAG: SPFH domain-containing protein [Peptostreptococcaceae bacterium]|nr:SPFH domain-containing protein [Peptostreptococcaceae bacterium]